MSARSRSICPGVRFGPVCPEYVMISFQVVNCWTRLHDCPTVERRDVPTAVFRLKRFRKHLAANHPGPGHDRLAADHSGGGEAGGDRYVSSGSGMLAVPVVGGA